MIIVAIILLLVPGLISIRILWRDKKVSREDYKYIVCDYLIYSFLIMLSVYAIMFFSYPQRTVALSTNVEALSNILSASFVFKYGFAALLFSIIMPGIVPKICKLWFNLEKGRKRKKEEII